MPFAPAPGLNFFKVHLQFQRPLQPFRERGYDATVWVPSRWDPKSNMVYKNNKRPASEDELCNISFKHSRQLDYTPFVGFALCNNSLEEPHKSGGFNNFRGEEVVVSRAISDFSVAHDEEFENHAFGGISGLSWVMSSTSEEDTRSEPTIQVSWSPGFCDDHCPSRTSVESEELFSSFISHPHRKLVSIGPDHQADVPEWGSEGARKASGYLKLSTQGVHDSDAGPSFLPYPLPLSASSTQLKTDDNWEQLMGTCVIPMPEADSSDYRSGNFGRGRVGCSCLDEGSVRCVRQHIKEAREKLLVTLGPEKFAELGFCDMGEGVAQKWSEEDEHFFHGVVFSNPASLGKNFWDHLSGVFPTKTKKDLVSYYFNVFMLRRRAEQNRLDPSNIDSDDDEWQASDDGDEFAITEDDDSAVESPADHFKTIYSEDSHEDNFHEDDEDDDDDDGIGGNDDSEGGADDVTSVEDDVGGLDDVSELHVLSTKPRSCKSLDSHKFLPTDHHASYDIQNGSEQDESCTSYECQQSGTVSSGPPDAVGNEDQPVETGHKNLHSEYGNSSLVGMVDHEYGLESCDAKVWDAGFFISGKNDIDFLPTCSMIEEVFRDEMWNENEARDGPCDR